ncbi:uncharacterized protein LOC117120334 isoform X2 [Anneissia japonica]|uniref:uncharacterized protein LOC117120334 isoform X2 n=1 Tax=Anneissia japonica TaxID=1529436 RepID=UPI0014258C44|nr:uncharacterized protein LOC117120334 isoform X2 [Anneissia japonica]
MLERWSRRSNVIIIVLFLHKFYKPATSQCPSRLSCKSNTDCYLIFSKDGKYHNAKNTDNSAKRARSSDECYTFTMKDEAPEPCSDTRIECIDQGGKIVNITNIKQYEGLMNEVLHILKVRSKATFNVQNIKQGEQCAYVNIQDGFWSNSGEIIQKHTDTNTTVNAVLCEQTDALIFSSTISTLTSSTISTLTPEQNQQTGKTDRMRTPIVIVVVCGIIILLLVFVGFAYSKVKTRKINNERAQNTLEMTTNACRYSNTNVYNDVSQTNIHNDNSTTRNVAPGDTYTYVATEIQSVTPQPELQDTIGRNYEQPPSEDDMYTNVQADAVVETDDCEYDKLNRSRAVTCAGDHDNTYNSLNEDAGDTGHYDCLQRSNIHNDNSTTRNVAPGDTYTYVATEIQSVTPQPELQDTIGRNYEQPLSEDDMYTNVQADAVVETDDCEYDKLNRSRAVTCAGDHDDTYNSLNEDAGDTRQYDCLQRSNIHNDNSTTRNVAPGDTYTYVATEIQSVTPQTELQDTIGRNYEQPLLEDDMYANVQADAVVETDDCEYDKFNRSRAVTCAGDHDDTYNSLNEDAGDTRQYDCLQRSNIHNDNSTTRNVAPGDTYTYVATEIQSVTPQPELQDTIGRNYEQPLLEDDMYANVQADAVVETDDCEYDKLNRSRAVTCAGDHDDTYNSLNEDAGDTGHYDCLQRSYRK